MATYEEIKAKVIEVIDDFALEDDVVPDYGTKYTANTKLNKIGVTEPVRAVMPKRFNKVMRDLVGATWKSVGAIDLVSIDTISGMISMACGQSGILLPEGEPT